MTAGKICIRGFHTAELDESVYAAAQCMHDHKVGSLVVVNASTVPVGIITDRDLTIRVLAEDRDPHLTTVGDIMSEHVQTVDDQLPVEQALEVMRSGPYRRLPVVDSNGKLIGLLSVDDILKGLAEEFRLVDMLLDRESPRSLTHA